MKSLPPRIVVYPKDIQNIVGGSRRSACNLLNRIKQINNKGRTDKLTIYEFCSYMKVDEQHVREFFKH